MGRKTNKTYRDPAEYAGYLFESAVVRCPKCGKPCRLLVSPKRGKARGIECTECTWSQYPGNAPTIHGPLSRKPDGPSVYQQREDALSMAHRAKPTQGTTGNVSGA
jgi:hypothetical protein